MILIIIGLVFPKYKSYSIWLPMQRLHLEAVAEFLQIGKGAV